MEEICDWEDEVRFSRVLDLTTLLENKSFFLFGPRSTGKTFLILEQLSKKALVVNLLESNVFLRLNAAPGYLRELIGGAGAEWVVIDEIQKIPLLLDEVHDLIEKKGIIFLLCGSSARKLRRGGVNLLAGRAWKAELFPLTYGEIPEFKLDAYLRFGGLPQVVNSKMPEEELNAYVDAYLTEEIRAEGFVRNLPAFSRFLNTAAFANGAILNFTKVGNDCGVAPTTVREYFTILEDTLMGFLVEPWRQSKKRKALSTAKFFFFDPGVWHAIMRTTALDRNSNLYGISFEQFIGMELRAYLSYRRKRESLNFWRTKHGHEVDFLIGDRCAIEVKASKQVTNRDTRGLRMLKEEGVFTSFYLVSQDPMKAKAEDVLKIHWREFLDLLWSDQII